MSLLYINFCIFATLFKKYEKDQTIFIFPLRNIAFIFL